MVYTCLFGHSEIFNDYRFDDEEVDFICFTDDRELKSSNWHICFAENKLLDPARLSKSFKHLPHRCLPEYDQSLYIDNTVRLVRPPSTIFSLLEETQRSLFMFRHPDRDCVYDEAEVVSSLRFDDPNRVSAQMRFYESLGYPSHNGLNKTFFLLRDHGDGELRKVNEAWHSQVLCHSKRDQLSWNVCAWMYNFQFSSASIDLENNHFLRWPVVPKNVRLPRDFDDPLYLQLHPDVARAGMNPRLHYLRYGMGEGRRYK
ncbi:MAG: hypothetical protein QOF41_509 [Methylobacteriaceae bacterium]|nr:hypothetical protein [Methylobacteriaceae bacterium]